LQGRLDQLGADALTAERPGHLRMEQHDAVALDRVVELGGLAVARQLEATLGDVVDDVIHRIANPTLDGDARFRGTVGAPRR
jgi:hypothetical protein